VLAPRLVIGPPLLSGEPALEEAFVLEAAFVLGPLREPAGGRQTILHLAKCAVWPRSMTIGVLDRDRSIPLAPEGPLL